MNKVTGQIRVENCVFNIKNAMCGESLRCEANTTSGIDMSSDLMYFNDEYGSRLCLLIWEKDNTKLIPIQIDKKPVLLWKHTIINP